MHNRMHAFQSASVEVAPQHTASAIIENKGPLHYASEAFVSLLQKEWPDWSGRSLPRDLHARLIERCSDQFDGNYIAVVATRIGALIFLRASRLDPLRRLSERETAVARLYGDGLAYKVIASRLGISPATVRVFLQRIYDKLCISDKAQLATLLARR